MSDLLSLKDLEGKLPTYLDCRENDVIASLYTPCLKRANTYVRGAGYFRSSVFRLMTEDLLEFCVRGGTIQLVTSTQMDIKDFDEAVLAYEKKNFHEDLESLLANPETVDATKMLCALIHHQRLELYVAVLRGDIYHHKKGYFTDTHGNIVAFDGSGNETLSALKPFDEGNAESFNIAWSWDSPIWDAYGSRWYQDLKRTIANDKSLTFPVVSIRELDREFIVHHGIDLVLDSHRDAARDRSKQLREKWDKIYGNRHFEDHLSKQEIDTALPKLYEHQSRGLKKWQESGFQGILEHATGSGKTITALSAIFSHLITGGNVVVLVPGEALLYQWKDEIQKYLPNTELRLMGAGEGGGKDALIDMRVNAGPPIVLLAISHSFRRANDLQRFTRTIQISDRKMLIVVDECHRLGAPSFAKICETTPHHRLGLSATPERQGDPDGTARLFGFLGPIRDQYGLKQALDDKHLTPYQYSIHQVQLTPSEQARYDKLKAEIRKNFAMLKKGEEPSDYLKTLVFRARRIIRSASGKIEAAAKVVDHEYERGQHWLIYCEDENMMDEVDQKLRERVPGLSPCRYWSGMDRMQRKKELQYFEEYSGVMLAIRCLDEGVDVPAISHGIVLSSSKTKREFIQRRGRLLRKSTDKSQSYIFDCFALPAGGGKEDGFILDEIRRAREFASTANNWEVIKAEIEIIMLTHGIEEEDLILEVETDE